MRKIVRRDEHSSPETVRLKELRPYAQDVGQWAARNADMPGLAAVVQAAVALCDAFNDTERQLAERDAAKTD